MANVTRHLALLPLAFAAVLHAQTDIRSSAPRESTDRPTSTATQPYDPLLDLPPLPHNKVTLMGGTIVQLDRVMNQITIQPFGGKQRLRVAFDSRSRIYKDGRPGNAQDMQPGARAYVDTMLDGTRVFAKTIQVMPRASSGNGNGQVLDYDVSSSMLTLRDELSQQPVHLRLSTTTVVRNGTETRSLTDLKPGSLVSLTFSNEQGRDVVHEISLLAQPGSTFSFFGNITFLDLSRRMIAVANQNDGKSYEIYLASIPGSVLRNLHEGAQVGISALFDGRHYVARSIEPAAGQNSEQ